MVCHLINEFYDFAILAGNEQDLFKPENLEKLSLIAAYNQHNITKYLQVMSLASPNCLYGLKYVFAPAQALIVSEIEIASLALHLERIGEPFKILLSIENGKAISIASNTLLQLLILAKKPVYSELTVEQMKHIIDFISTFNPIFNSNLDFMALI